MKTAVFASFLSVLSPLSVGASQLEKRLHSNINESETFILKGSIRPAVSLGLAQDAGPVSPSQPMPRMSLHFSLTAAQQADLNELLKAQQDRRSPQYRKFLTPEQYAERFGLHPADLAKISAWLEGNGFSNIQTARSHAWISFSGDVAQAQLAFHTSIHSYALNGETHMANASEAELPRALQGIVTGISGLHNFTPKPSLVSELRPHYTSGSGANYLVPDDWETIYDVKPLYAASLDGSPIAGFTYSIAVVGQSDVLLSDLRAFRSAAGLAAKDPVVIVPPGDSDPGMTAGSKDEVESDLDLEWAGGIAKNANIAFVIADTNPDGGVNDAIRYAIDNSIAPVISTSYGECETNVTPTEFTTQNTLFQQAAAQGITVVAAAGDRGAADCDTGTVATHGLAVRFPASSQYVTGVGGTEFNPASGVSYFSSSNNANGGSATSYIPEVAWNDALQVTNAGQTATGGGASALVTKPSWQTGTGVPSDGQRDVPDIALTASSLQNPYIICTEGSCSSGFANSSSSVHIIGGTSAGTPSFAGVVALLVQKTGTKIGLLNSNMYSLAGISSNAFHDIIAGNNQVVCQGGSTGCPNTTSTGTGVYGFTAGVGYDQVTGLGSIDANNFVEQWSGDIQLSANPATLNITSLNDNPPPTVSVTATPVNNFSGPITFSCSVSSNLASAIACSVPSTPINSSGSVTVTISPISSGSAFLRRIHWPKLPPNSRPWAVVAFLMAIAMWGMKKYQLIQVRSAYALAAAVCVTLTLGAVSCGSGSSSNILAMTCNLPEPIQGVPYLGGYCTATGGKTPYTYTILTGSAGGTGNLPTGITLNGSTGAITGTPTTAGAFTFTIEVTDSESTPHMVSQNDVLSVQPPLVVNGYVTVTATSGAIVNSTKIIVSSSL